MAEHNFLTQGPKAWYNPKGQYRTCYSKEEVAVAKQDGFTSSNYVRSNWPKTAFHKKTGNSKPVGKLDDSDEKNAAAVVALGPEWTLDHVPVPEPVAATPPPSGGGDMLAMLGMMAEMKKRMDDLEDAAIAQAAIRDAMQNRVVELESIVDAISVPVSEDLKKKKN